MLRDLVVLLACWAIILFGVVVFFDTALGTDLLTLKDYKTSFYAATGNTNQVDSTVVRLVNAGIAMVTNETGCFQKYDTVITSDGNSDYALNTDCIANGVIRVELKREGKREVIAHISRIGKAGKESGCPDTWQMSGTELDGAYLTVSPEGTADACTLIVRYAAAAPYRTDDSMNVQIPRRLGWYAVQAAKFEYQRAFDIQVNTQELTEWQAAMNRERARYVPRVDVKQ
jgi:hypothetical protein